MTSTAHVQTLRLRLFIEGMEVPVIAASVQASPNSPSVATIQIPPLVEATRFHPRTTIHLFFLDLYRSSPAINDTGRLALLPEEGVRPPNAAEREQSRMERGADELAASWAEAYDTQNDQWRLLFGGEIVGFTWTKNYMNRSIILQCEDWSNYWDYAFQSDNTGIFGPGMKAIFSGSSTNLFTDFLQTEGEVITNIVVSGRCNTFPKLKGLAAGIIRLLEAVGGSYYVFPSEEGQYVSRRIAGQNIFFSYNELRLHLTQLLGIYDKDPTSENIMRRGGYGSMFQRALGGQGGQVSIRGAINALTKVIFYEMFPQPCPRYKPGAYGQVSGTKHVKLDTHPTLGRFAVAAQDMISGLSTLHDNLRRFVEDDTFPPPSAEVNATRADPNGFRERLRRLAIDQVRELASIFRNVSRTRYQMYNAPKSATGAMSTALQKVSRALTLAQKLYGASVGSISSVESIRAQLQALYEEAIAELYKVANTDVLVGGGKERSPAQLYQQVFRPDVWFAAPPRCNVFFPEQYDNFSYQRMFLREPTRYMLKTNDEFFGEDILFDSFYFAPQAGTVDGSRLSMAALMGKRELLNHERFTGILPIFEKMGEMNIFASRGDGLRYGIKKIGLAQRSANFLYFRHRFNARRAMVTGKFNPYVAVGCPGLIIDRYVDRSTIEHHNELRRQRGVIELENSGIIGTNFLGNFTQVSHQISNPQPLGMTEITLTFPRQPDESVEFLGSLPEEVIAKKRIEGGDAVRSTDVAAISPPQVYSIGPNRGVITNVQQVSDQYVNRTLNTFYPDNRRDTSFRPAEVPIGVPVSASQLGYDETVSAILGGQDVKGTFQAYRLTEEIPRYKTEEVLLPAEEYIRPGWYGDVWTNSKVGEVWQELFSTGSITDPVNVNDQGRSSVSMRSEDSQEAAVNSGDATVAADPEAVAPALIDLQEGASIQQAVEFLQLTYSYIRQAGLDTDEFIGAYIWRPIASMVDIFGTSDLQYDETGQTVLQGYEGFHSRAVGPYQNLFGLVNEEIESVLGIKRGSTAAQVIDVRMERRRQVEKYLVSLLYGNALLG